MQKKIYWIKELYVWQKKRGLLVVIAYGEISLQTENKKQKADHISPIQENNFINVFINPSCDNKQGGWAKFVPKYEEDNCEKIGEELERSFIIENISIL